jgi:hypothetical protein
VASGQSHFLKAAPAAKTDGLVLLPSLLIEASTKMVVNLMIISVDAVPKATYIICHGFWDLEENSKNSVLVLGVRGKDPKRVSSNPVGLQSI